MAALLVDLPNQCLNNMNVPPAVYTGTTQGTALLMSNAEVTTNAIVNVGNYIIANLTAINVQIEECATTNGTFTAITNMITTVTTSNAFYVMRGLRTQAYARANVVTATGTTISFACCVDIVAQLKDSGTGGGYSNAPLTSP